PQRTGFFADHGNYRPRARRGQPRATTGAATSQSPSAVTIWAAPKEEESMHRPSRAAFAPSLTASCAAVIVAAGMLDAPARAAEGPDLIFGKWTVFHWVSPNDKLGTYGVAAPEGEGAACHFTVPERGGFKGWLGLAEEVSDISLACRQTGPIRFKEKFPQGD